MPNNTTLWISLSDVVEMFNISPNTEPKYVNTHIQYAQDFDFKAVFALPFYTAINDSFKAYKGVWITTANYVVGDIILDGGVYYKAIANNVGSQPPSANWQTCELLNFFNQYIKDWLSGVTMVRYMPYYGTHATQWGFEQYGQEGFQAVSDKRLAEILNAVKSTKNAFESTMIIAFNEAKGTFDGVKYELVSCGKTTNRQGFSIIGVNKFDRR